MLITPFQNIFVLFHFQSEFNYNVKVDEKHTFEVVFFGFHSIDSCPWNRVNFFILSPVSNISKTTAKYRIIEAWFISSLMCIIAKFGKGSETIESWLLWIMVLKVESYPNFSREDFWKKLSRFNHESRNANCTLPSCFFGPNWSQFNEKWFSSNMK